MLLNDEVCEIMNEEIYQNNKDYLAHYGILGMKWGVRRASRQLRKATNKDSMDEAIRKLNKHKIKGEAKIAALDNERKRLDNNLRKSITKDKVKSSKLEKKAAKIDRKAAKLKSKSIKWYRSDSSAAKLISKSEVKKIKADKLHAKASVYNAKYEKVKAKVDANDSIQKAFKTQLNNIDNIIVENGKRYING